MSLIQPIILWLLPLLALPVVIHLIGRERTKRLEFSTLRFLYNDALKEDRSRKLRRILLLILRLLIIALLILFFAGLYSTEEPFMKFHSSKTKVYCWVDRTPSMLHRDKKGRSAFSKALNILDAVDSLKSDFRVFNGKKFVLPEKARDLRSGIKHGPSDFSEMLDVYTRISSREDMLFIVSDFQEREKPDYTQVFEKTDSAVTMVFVNTSAEDPVNYSLTSMTAPGPEGGNVRVGGRAWGSALDSGRVSVYSGDLRAGSGYLSIPEDSSEVLEVETGPLRPDKALSGVLMNSEDAFPLDDTVFAAVEKGSSGSVMITGERDLSYPVIAGFEALYGEGERRVVFRRDSEAGFSDIENSEIIVLSGVDSPSNSLSSLKGGAGGKLIVFFPADGGVQGFTGSIASYLSQDWGVRENEQGVHPLISESESGVFKGFSKELGAGAVIRSWITGLKGEVLLRNSKGEPFATAVKKDGNIWILFSAFCGVSESNSISESGLFVPMLDRITEYGTSRLGMSGRTWTAGYQESNPAAGSSGSGADVYDLSTGELAFRWMDEPYVSIDRPGVYRVNMETGEDIKISVIGDTAEGKMVFSDPDPGPEHAGRSEITDPEGLRRKAENRESNLDLYIIIILVLILAGEMGISASLLKR